MSLIYLFAIGRGSVRKCGIKKLIDISMSWNRMLKWFDVLTRLLFSLELRVSISSACSLLRISIQEGNVRRQFITWTRARSWELESLSPRDFCKKDKTLVRLPCKYEWCKNHSMFSFNLLARSTDIIALTASFLQFSILTLCSSSRLSLTNFIPDVMKSCVCVYSLF